MKIHESDYDSQNYHVARYGTDLLVDVTHPPYDDKEAPERVRYVQVNQESVRASDGVRLYYDFERDGFVVQQPKFRTVETGPMSSEEVTDWIEVGFFQSWHFGGPNEHIDKLETAK